MNSTEPVPSAVDTYDSRTVMLHWVSAVLVLALWVLGQCVDFFPKGTPRITARSLHISLGLLLGVVLIVRLVWRFAGGVQLPVADSGLAARLAASVHRFLYVLLVASVVAGMAYLWIRGDTLFNWFTVPAFDPGNKALRDNAGEVHEFMANLLLIVAGLHALAAVWHHRVMRDGVLRRMWPGLAPIQSD
jgi:cytochrome b561